MFAVTNCLELRCQLQNLFLFINSATVVRIRISSKNKFDMSDNDSVTKRENALVPRADRRLQLAKILTMKKLIDRQFDIYFEKFTLGSAWMKAQVQMASVCYNIPWYFVSSSVSSSSS